MSGNTAAAPAAAASGASESGPERLAEKQERLRKVHQTFLNAKAIISPPAAAAAEEEEATVEDSPSYYFSTGFPTRGPDTDAAQRLIGEEPEKHPAPCSKPQWTGRSSGVYVCVLTTALVYLGCGMVFFALTEHWSASRAIYFVVLSFCTIGYGTVTPTHPDTRFAFACYSILGLVILGVAVAAGCRLVNRAAQTRTSGAGPLQWLDEQLGFTTRQLVLLWVAQILLLTIGTMFFKLNNSDNADVSWIDAFYLTVSTLTTNGAADVAIEEDTAHMWFCIFFVILCFPVTVITLVYIARLWFEQEDSSYLSKLSEQISANPEFLKSIDATSQESVTFHEFLVHTLRQMDRVDDKMLGKLHEIFLAANSDGTDVILLKHE